MTPKDNMNPCSHNMIVAAYVLQLDLQPKVAVWLGSGTGTTWLGGRKPQGLALLMNAPVLHTQLQSHNVCDVINLVSKLK